MEAMGGTLFLDGEWESLCKMFSTDQDPAFNELLGHNSDHLPSDQGLLSLIMSEPIDPIAPFLTQMPYSNHFSQTSSSDLSYDSSNADSPHYLMQPNNVNDDQLSCLPSFDFLMEDSLLMGQLGFPAVIEGPINGPMDGAAGDHSSSAKRSCADDQLEMEVEAPVPKKRARVSKRANNGKKKTQPEKNKNEDIEEETDEAPNGLNTSGDMSDNESNASQEVINEAHKQTVNMNGKKRANRGAATDPQSLYARRRRERINERLRILQTLVPNGTKVDISTMLEEAVHYVKFLQLQIKLLSSDEMWMYAPLAYSGFDMGLYKRFSPYMLRP